MQRKENESFTDYQARRAEDSRAVKLLNAESKGGKSTARETQRAARNGFGAGWFGKQIRANAAKKRMTASRLARHKKHIAHMAERAAARLIVSRTTGAQIPA